MDSKEIDCICGKSDNGKMILSYRVRTDEVDEATFICSNSDCRIECIVTSVADSLDWVYTC